jgi:SAM-dependent methyltransferase
MKLTYWADKGETDLDVLSEHIRDRGYSVLDIGCGSGHALEMFRNQGCDVTGVDPDCSALSAAQEKGLRVLEGTAENLPGSCSGYDIVTMTHVLEHTLNPSAALVNAGAVLKPDGLFYCVVPNAEAEHFRTFSQISEMLDVPRHLYFFTKKSLRQFAAKSGFRVVSWHYSGYLRHHSPSWRAWESDIYDRIRKRGEQPSVPRHNFSRSAWLAARTLCARPTRKYDCIGFLARRANLNLMSAPTS